MSRGEKSKKKKMKMRTQNEKNVETAIDYGIKHIKKHLLETRQVSSRMNYL